MKLQSSQETRLYTYEVTLLHVGSVLRVTCYVYTVWCIFPPQESLSAA